jgi:hypothetical protein
MDEMVYLGANGPEVRDWVNSDPGVTPGETWFLTRNQSGPTGGQAWRYVKDQQGWDNTVVAAVFDARTGDWAPVRKGETIERQGSGYGVKAV